MNKEDMKLSFLFIKNKTIMSYEKISHKEGIEFFPKVWTIFLSKNPKLWANPFENRKLRPRCIFEKSNGISNKMTVYLHLTDEEIISEGIESITEEIFLYGAYNQVQVYQMKGIGKIREMTGEEKKKFVKLVKDRLKGENIGDRVDLSMSKNNDMIPKIMTSGKFFCFEPTDYEYNMYERG